MKPIQLLLLLSSLLFHCSTKTTNHDFETELSHVFRTEFPADDEPGGSVLVKKGDSVAFQLNFGLADLKTGEKITEHTAFNTGSISKTFVANGILILRDSGRLSLDDSIAAYFDEFKNKNIANRVTVRHLLSHTSGLPDVRRTIEDSVFYITAKDEENWAPIMQVESLKFQPGERYEYSNPAFNGLALIIQKLTNSQWQSFIEDNIFKVSGMSDSKVTDGPYPESGVSHGYALENGEYAEYDYGEYPTFAASGNGGVWSSVTDLAKYEDAIQSNKFLSAETIRESRTVFHPGNWSASHDPFIGCSWFVGEESLFGSSANFGVDFVYHTGSQGGFRAFYVTIPDKDIVFVALFNRPPKNFDQLLLNAVNVLKKYNWLN